MSRLAARLGVLLLVLCAQPACKGADATGIGAAGYGHGTQVHGSLQSEGHGRLLLQEDGEAVGIMVGASQWEARGKYVCTQPCKLSQRQLTG